ERVRSRDNLLGVSRQIEAHELRGGVWHDADATGCRRDEAIAAFQPPRPRIGVELGAQLIESGNRYSTIGGDVLPAVRQGGRDVGRPLIVTHIGAELEQVRSPGAAV